MPALGIPQAPPHSNGSRSYLPCGDYTKNWAPPEILAVSQQHISMVLLSFRRRGNWDIRINIEHSGGPKRKIQEMVEVGNNLSSTVGCSQAYAGLRLTDEAGRILSTVISSLMNLLYLGAWIKQEPDEMKYKATLTQNSLMFFSLFPLLENELFLWKQHQLSIMTYHWDWDFNHPVGTRLKKSFFKNFDAT